MNSWRDILDDILVITGLTHPGYFSSWRINEYFLTIAKITDMKVHGDPVIRQCPDIPILGNGSCSGYCGWQSWVTSGCSIYTWDVGKITIVIHTCKPLDVDKAVQASVEFWRLCDYDVEYIKLPKKEVKHNDEL